ncbi:RND transporter [Actinomycetospora chibensis]|uniref:RND transporter n=1 Tax=Actinomycetospora chibensis TaxID=663606 RepID=A0ABV9RI91_9PSEU|nr:RND transporter [Actinomycetospora chibensis]MDD7925096.1 RND transporter [Actinomycetospora chibensis]
MRGLAGRCRRLVRGVRLRLRRLSRREATAGLAALLVGVFVLGGLAQVRLDTSIDSFLPAGDPVLQGLQDKADAFGGDPVVVLLESPQPRGLLHGPELSGVLRLEGSLANLPDVAEVYGPGTVLNQIAASAKNLLAQISGRRDALRTAAVQQARNAGAPDTAAAAAGDAALADYDRRYGSLVVSALPAGLPTLSNPRFVDSVIFGGSDRVRPQWGAIVPAPNTVAILVRPRAALDQGGTTQLVDGVRAAVGNSGLPTSRVTVTGVPAVTAALTDQARQEFPILGALALLGVGLLSVLVPWSRRRRDRLRPLLATLLGTALTLAAFGWTGRPLSLGVVAFLPILLGIGSDFPLYLAQPARRRRVLVAALAGAAGFGALAASSLPFVRELGIALAVGIVLTVGVSLALRRWLDVLEPTEVGSHWVLPRPRRGRWWVRVSALVVAGALAAGGWAALPALRIDADPESLAAGLPALEQAQEAERVLRASGEINVVLRGPDVLTPAALAWTREAEDVVDRGYGDRIHPITTASTLFGFLGRTPTQEQIQAASELLPRYLASAVIQSDRRTSLGVYGIELQDLRQQSALVASLRADLPPPPPGYTSDVVGLPVAAARAYDVVSSDRVLLTVLALVAAGLVLLIGLRERRDALRAILAVVLSTGWVLEVAWLVIGALTPLTMAVGALTTATGCEFTVMLAEARRGRRPWLLRSVALAVSAAVLGYLALTASDLAVLRQFGLLLAVGVITSALAAVLVVEVLLPPTETPASDRPVDTRSPAPPAPATRGGTSTTGASPSEDAGHGSDDVAIHKGVSR